MLSLQFSIVPECAHSEHSCCLKYTISSTLRNSLDFLGKVTFKRQNIIANYLLLNRSLLMAEVRFLEATEINIHRGL